MPFHQIQASLSSTWHYIDIGKITRIEVTTETGEWRLFFGDGKTLHLSPEEMSILKDIMLNSNMITEDRLRISQLPHD